MINTLFITDFKTVLFQQLESGRPLYQYKDTIRNQLTNLLAMTALVDDAKIEKREVIVSKNLKLSSIELVTEVLLNELAISNLEPGYIEREGKNKLKLIGTSEFVAGLMPELQPYIQEDVFEIDWVTDVYGSITPVLSHKVDIDNDLYPNLNENFTSYADRYFNSKSSVIVLIGPPGTGKTTFIRGLMSHSKSKCTVAFDPKVISSDDFFSNFIEYDSDVLVLEDMDSFLAPRTETGGDTSLMHKFLNLSDGLINIGNKKIIITTNLKDVSEIDSALIRPGRCFDVLHFDLYTPEQAEKIADKYGKNLTPDKEAYSLADILSDKQENTETKEKIKAGFV